MPDIPYVEDVTRFWLPVAPTTNNLYEKSAQIWGLARWFACCQVSVHGKADIATPKQGALD